MWHYAERPGKGRSFLWINTEFRGRPLFLRPNRPPPR